MYQVFSAVSSKPHVRAFRCLSLAVGLLYLGFASLAVAEAAPADNQDGSRTGNILLREYFLGRYLELRGERTLFPGSVAVPESARRSFDPMAEHFVDVQVEQYMEELEQKLRAIKSTVKELESVRQNALSDRSTWDLSTRARVRELAEDVGDRAGDLYNMLSIVVVDLRARNDVPVPKTPAGKFFANELRFLRRQVGKAEGRIKALFLEPTHTVGLEELRGDNVLTELKSIERVSKYIEKKADALPAQTDLAE